MLAVSSRIIHIAVTSIIKITEWVSLKFSTFSFQSGRKSLLRVVAMGCEIGPLIKLLRILKGREAKGSGSIKALHLHPKMRD